MINAFFWGLICDEDWSGSTVNHWQVLKVQARLKLLNSGVCHLGELTCKSLFRSVASAVTSQRLQAHMQQLPSRGFRFV